MEHPPGAYGEKSSSPSTTFLELPTDATESGGRGPPVPVTPERMDKRGIQGPGSHIKEAGSKEALEDTIFLLSTWTRRSIAADRLVLEGQAIQSKQNEKNAYTSGKS